MSIESVLKFSSRQICRVPINGYGLPSDQQTQVVLDQITQYKNCDLVLLDKSLGPCDQDHEYLAWAQNLSIKQDWAVVTSNYNYWSNKHSQIIYYPCWYFILLQDLNLKHYDMIKPRPYQMACLNRNPWLHRTMNLLAMSKQSWWSQCQFSFGAPDRNSFDTCPEMTVQDIDFLTSIYPTQLTIPDQPNKFVSNHCSAHELCYLDYVTESRCDMKFASEKIWKPMLSGQLFFVLGPQGLVQHLRDLGLDVFDDYLNHEYDSIGAVDQKISSLMHSIGLVIDHLDQIWNDTCHRRLQNLTQIKSQQFQQKLLQDLISRVS